MKNLGRPTPGFWVLVGTAILVLAFFVFGFRTPRLDRIWEMEQQLKTGDIQRLSSGQKQLFYDVFEKFPKYEGEMSGRRGIDLISANTDGYSLSDELLILRTEKADNCGNFVLDVSGEQSEFPIVFAVQGRTWKREVKWTKSGRRKVWLPRKVLMPEFIEVKRKNNENEIGNVDVKVRFCN